VEPLEPGEEGVYNMIAVEEHEVEAVAGTY